MFLEYTLMHQCVHVIRITIIHVNLLSHKLNSISFWFWWLDVLYFIFISCVACHSPVRPTLLLDCRLTLLGYHNSFPLFSSICEIRITYNESIWFCLLGLHYNTQCTIDWFLSSFCLKTCFICFQVLMNLHTYSTWCKISFFTER